MNLVTKFLSVLGLTLAMNVTAIAALPAPVLVTDAASGTLLGAKGVTVNGSLYDVSFGDGILGSSISSFTSFADAYAASLSLANSVFVGQYDTLPGRTRGCVVSQTSCGIATPFSTFADLNGTYISVAEISNYMDEVNDFVLINAINYFTDVDASQSDFLTLAVWNVAEQTATVPEPEAYAMMFAGLGLLEFVARRRKQKAAV